MAVRHRGRAPRQAQAGLPGLPPSFFVRACQFDTIDFEFEEVVKPVVEAADDWPRYLDAVYVLDEPPTAFCAFERPN